jgi:hypothetical protein
LRKSSGLQELVRREARASGFETEPGEGIENHLRQTIEIADQKREEPDIERLLHEVSNHVLIGCPSPEQAGERHVDDDQRRGQKRHLAAEQAEA